MPISDNGTRDQYTATAAQTIFPYTFEIFDEDDIAVEQNGTLLTKGTHYTVSGVNNDSGGNVTLVTGATAGDILTLYRNMALERVTDYQNSGDFLADTVDNDFDRLWAATQQVYTKAKAAIRAPVDDAILNESNTELAAPSVRGGKALGFTTSGALDYLSSAVPNGDFTHVSTVAAMTALTGLSAGVDVIQTAEFSTGDFGGGVYDVVLTSSVTTNGFNIIQGVADPTISFVLRDGDYVNVAQWGIKGDNSDEGLAIQAAMNYAYDNIGAIFFPFGKFNMGNRTLEFPPSTTTEFRGDAFKILGQGAGNAFVTVTPSLATTITNSSSTLPVLRYVNRLAFVNTGGAFDVRGIRFEGNNNSQVAQFDQVGEYSFFKRNEIYQAGTGDGVTIDYFMKGNIENCNILNADSFEPADLSIVRTGAGMRIKAGDGGGIPSLKKITSRGFDFGYILGENATAADNMSALYLEQCESSVVRVGINIKPFTQKPTLNTCYFEGIEEVHIIDDGTASDIFGCQHFVNAESLGGVTYYKSVTATKGNNYHHNYLETNTQGDTLVDVAFDEFKSIKHNTILYAGTTKAGVSGIIVRGIFPKFDISSNTFSPRGAWLGGNTTGTHNGANNVAVLSDSTANFNPDGLIGMTVTNSTDGSSGTITANTRTTITATLAGGTDNDWDTGDSYSINNHTTKIRYLDTGGVRTGFTEAQNGSDFSCPMINGAVSFISGQAVLTQSHVSGNTLTLPDEVNHFTFTPTVPVSINTIVGTSPNHQHIRFDVTNTNVTFTNSAFLKVAGGTSYTGVGAIEFDVRKVGANYFAYENYRALYV